MRRHPSSKAHNVLILAVLVIVAVLLPAARLSAQDPVQRVNIRGTFTNIQPAEFVLSRANSQYGSRIIWGSPIGLGGGGLIEFNGFVGQELNIGGAFDLGYVGFLKPTYRPPPDYTPAPDPYDSISLDLEIELEFDPPLNIPPPRFTHKIYVSSDTVYVPRGFAQSTFTVGGVAYTLSVIGFDPESVIPCDASQFCHGIAVAAEDRFVVPIASGAHSVRLLGVINRGCVPGSGVPVPETITNMGTCGKDSLGRKRPTWGSFGERDSLVSVIGEKLELECSETKLPFGLFDTIAFQLFYTPAGSSSRLRVGLCPFQGGCNIGQFWHSGAQNNSPGCFIRTRWVSKDFDANDNRVWWNPFGLNVLTGELERGGPGALDWLELIYDVNSNYMSKANIKWEYLAADENFVPTERCTAPAFAKVPSEGNRVSVTMLKDPPLGPITEAFFDEVIQRMASIPVTGVAMVSDTTPPCDVNSDGTCDDVDVNLFEKSVGKCRIDANYDPRADADGSGCVDTLDRHYLFTADQAADQDNDGIEDARDNCPTVSNPDQADGDGDGMGDVCATKKGDLDRDGDVDRSDLDLLLAARNRPATGTTDPKDLDRDGVITVLDARALILLCTRAACAINP